MIDKAVHFLASSICKECFDLHSTMGTNKLHAISNRDTRMAVRQGGQTAMTIGKQSKLCKNESFEGFFLGHFCTIPRQMVYFS